MAGLLDFMYSGQVNVKYEDLPKFLKVAEIMQIKGLHTEVSGSFIIFILTRRFKSLISKQLSILRVPTMQMKINMAVMR